MNKITIKIRKSKNGFYFFGYYKPSIGGSIHIKMEKNTVDSSMVGKEVDIMLTKAYNHRDVDGNVTIQLYGQPITDDYILINHNGFECATSMCTTVASLPKETQAIIKEIFNYAYSWVTPGWCNVKHVSNVNLSFRGQTYKKPIPGFAYMSKTDILNHKNRICGVPNFDEFEIPVSRFLKIENA